MYFLHVIISSS